MTRSAGTVAAGDVIPLTIEKPAAGGWMIGRVDRLVVLVSGTMPGERVRVRINRLGKGVAFGSTAGVDEASPHRRTPDGDPACGGCLYAHIAYAHQLELKALVVADALSRIGKIQLDGAVAVAPSAEDGYRMRARLHLRGGLAGFYREGTHDVCDPRPTHQLLPATMDAIDRLMSAMGAVGVDGIGELELSENVEASHRAIHLTPALGSPPPDERALEQLAAVGGLTGVSSTGQQWGDVYVLDSIGAEGGPRATLRRHVLSFFQGNRYLLNQLVTHVAGLVPAGSRVVDLYAGVGLFAVAAAVLRGAHVIAVEGDRMAAADLLANAAALDGGVVPVRSSVEEHVRRPPEQTPGTLILDPPRAGVSREALGGICGMGVARVVYVSCDVATLARDARTLASRGYRLEQLDAFDLFPNTPHVETVAVFQRT